ncbi:hypothetical protein SMD20_06890 [Nonomuraea sp. LP-02]|uniref:hypothetical protein n=1 Tax=Nonomuraea sp. LP-02 TaxID=3097960 RepID=UPI002E33559E|nr:hypothetical protein [Nonomuraea sp. LP-02]MED7923950.1 hypothetical protein [Nonomuraea sp. LP-02]
MTERLGGESLEDIYAEYLVLAFPEADAHQVRAQAASAAERARQAMQAPYEPATPRMREHLTQALRQLNGHELTRAGLAQVRYLGVTVVAEMVARAGGRGELRLAVTGGYTGMWLALTAGRADLHYLACVDANGRAVFADIPAADWTVELVDEVPSSSAVIPLPVLRPLLHAAAAATHDFVLVLPSGVLFHVNRSGPLDSYVLEIMAVPTQVEDGPGVFLIRYMTEGTPSGMLVPVAARAPVWRTRVRLPGFSPDNGWETTPLLNPQAVPPDDDLLARSIEAAIDRATLRAWHGLVPHLPPDTAEIVSAQLSAR